MARTSRIEGAGFWYHVMCSGNAGQHVFADSKVNEPFLKRLGTVTAERIESVMGHVARRLAQARCGTRMTMRKIGKETGGVSGGTPTLPWSMEFCK